MRGLSPVDGREGFLVVIQRSLAARCAGARLRNAARCARDRASAIRLSWRPKNGASVWASISAAPRSRSSRSTGRRASSAPPGRRRRGTIIVRRSRRSRDSSRRPKRELGVARDRRGRHAGIDLARHRPPARLEFGVPQRPADPARSRARARARGAHHQRRQLLRAVRGDRRGGRGRGRRLRRHPRHRRRLGHRRARSTCSTGPMRSPANGVTTRCRGRATTSVRARRCYCGRDRLHRDVSVGPGPRARPSRARPASVARRAGHRRRAPPRAMPRARRHSPATRSGSRARSRT